MRTFRISLAGALVFVVLAGFGNGLAAQPTDEGDGGSPKADYFTAKTEWTLFGVGHIANDFLWFEGPTLASDDRLTGDSGVWFIETNDGRLHVRNDEGEWFGPLKMAPQEGRYGAWLVGAGAYEGMTALVHGTMEFPLTEEGGFNWAPPDELLTATSAFQGWVFAEPPSKPAWMKEYGVLFP